MASIASTKSHNAGNVQLKRQEKSVKCKKISISPEHPITHAFGDFGNDRVERYGFREEEKEEECEMNGRRDHATSPFDQSDAEGENLERRAECYGEHHRHGTNYNLSETMSEFFVSRG